MDVKQAIDIPKGDTNRQVWILNSFSQPHKEMYRGDEWIIPANSEKKVLKPYLDARQFLGQITQRGEQAPNGTWISAPKMLRTEELTVEEQKALLGMGPKENEDRIEELEARAALVCTMCGFQSVSDKGLKIHTTKEHPHATPAKDD
jgi:hypothetical protein